MQRLTALLVVAIVSAVAIGLAQQSSSGGPYKILKRANVGGEGNWDYIYADVAGRRLYIPRRGGAAPGAAIPTRLTIFNLDTLEPISEIAGVGGNGTAVDPKSGHGFTYVFSHPTKDATVIDSRDGTVLGVIDLGGVPEQGVSDGKGTLYVVMQDPQGSVTAVDVKTMKAVAHYPFGDKGGGCNGLALDNKNHVLFAACARSGDPAADPPKPMMVILRADDGKILANLPLAGGSDGAAFNPATMEAFSTHGNGTLTVVKETSPTTFEVEQNLETMNFARTIAFDSKTNHIFVMAEERGPAPPPPPGGGRGGRGAAKPGTFTILMIGK